ncbi:putative RNA recognition motif protein, partial [Gregarina niphandrodes]
RFFEGYQMLTILPTTVPVDGRPSGEAYVEFKTAAEASRALRTRQKARMERRYIELFASSKEEMDMAANGWDSREIRARIARPAPTL